MLNGGSMSGTELNDLDALLADMPSPKSDKEMLRDRLIRTTSNGSQIHSGGAGEKRKLDEPGDESMIGIKSQKMDSDLMAASGLDSYQDNPNMNNNNNISSSSSNGNGGRLLAQALMEKGRGGGGPMGVRSPPPMVGDNGLAKRLVDLMKEGKADEAKGLVADYPQLSKVYATMQERLQFRPTSENYYRQPQQPLRAPPHHQQMNGGNNWNNGSMYNNVVMQPQKHMQPQQPRPQPHQRFYNEQQQQWVDPNKAAMMSNQGGYYRHQQPQQQPQQQRQPPVMPMRPINNSYEFNNGYGSRPAVAPNYGGNGMEGVAPPAGAYRFGSPNSCQQPMYSPSGHHPNDSMQALRMSASFDSNFGGGNYNNQHHQQQQPQQDFMGNGGGYMRPAVAASGGLMRPQQQQMATGNFNNYQQSMRPYNNDNMFNPSNGYNSNMMSADMMGSSFDGSDLGDPVIGDFMANNAGGRPQIEPLMDWKASMGDLRKSLLSRLKDECVAQNVPNAVAMAEATEAKVFSMSSSQKEYTLKLAEWLASIYDKDTEAAATSQAPDSAAAASSGLNDVTTTSSNGSELSEVANDLMLATPTTSESCLSPAHSPTSTSAASTLTSTSAASPSFAMPVLTSTTALDESTSNKLGGLKQQPPQQQQRRTSGSASTASNNPQSVDSGLGSPRSITSASSSTLYSPKIQGTSPSLLTASENSPDKTTAVASS